MGKKVIGITTGDQTGIGLEVTTKALSSLKGSSSVYVIWQSSQKTKFCWKPLPKKTSLIVRSLDDALSEVQARRSPYRFIHIDSDDSPAHWVKEAAQGCLDGKLSGMVTGPVSKKTFLEFDRESIGHTPLLKKQCKATSAYMGFLGSRFNVVLLTGHLPLSNIEKALTPAELEKGFKTVSEWTAFLPTKLRRRPLGILGLNPHSGESGVIGTFEQNILGPLLKKYPHLRGPLVPDAAFLKENWDKFSFYISLYHDQGLIPFKMIHGHSGGAHVTLGLPIIRTSVDHGTAEDIYGKGIAQANSMRDAIKWCEALTSKKG
ncbi:MAG: hypothetical protein RJB66_2358 [Pseudomonadota bacterium]|jgi:4-hydroxythreonine-4-phosphate dehydrogenase